MIDVRQHQNKLATILVHYGLPESSLALVPDVQAWCQTKQIEEDYPFRLAKCFYTSDTCYIVMRCQITSAMANTAKAHMELNGLGSEVEQLDSDVKFLVHLLLHEIACYSLQMSEHLERDVWAFAELSHHVA